MRHYILDENGTPVVELDRGKWAAWVDGNGPVALTKIGPSTVSTVFLGLDHNLSEGPPILWETMVFGGPLDLEQERCSGSREQAEAMHARMVDRVKAI